MKFNNVEDCQLIKLKTFNDDRGTLSFAEGERDIPFAIKRIFYIYGVPEDKNRGAHAHKEVEQFLICLKGMFTMIVDDSRSKKEFILNDAAEGLFIPSGIWGELQEFSRDAICLVLVSDFYSETDYLRSYDSFRHYRAENVD